MFMRRFILIGLGLMVAGQGFGATTSGILQTDETWSGVVTLTGDVTVPAGITLTIHPGTRVECWDKYDDTVGGIHNSRIELIISGTLNAIGTSTNRVLFTSSPAVPPAKMSDWYGFRLKSSAASLQWCNIEYAAEGIRIESGPPTLTNCLIHNCSTGVSFYTSGSMQGCQIKSNDKGIYLEVANLASPRNVTLTECQIIDNISYGIFNQQPGFGMGIGNIYTIYLNHCLVSGNDDGIFYYNQLGGINLHGIDTLIVSNRSSGIRVKPLAYPPVYAPEIKYGDFQGLLERCRIDSNGQYGILAYERIYISSVDSSISWNGVHGFHNENKNYAEIIPQLTNCFIVGNGGFGVSIHNPSSALGLNGCIIASNWVGISVCSAGATVSGITNCSIHNNRDYDVSNATAQAVVARNIIKECS